MANRLMRVLALCAMVLAPVGAVVLTPSVAVAQGEVIMKPELTPGREMKYSLGMGLEVTQKVGDGNEQKTTMRCGATAAMKVVEVSPEGVAKLMIQIEKAELEAPLGDQDVGYAWPLANPLPEDASAVRKLGPIIGAAKIEATVDPKGNVTIVSGLEDFTAAAANANYPDERIMGMFTPAKLAMALTPIFKLNQAGDAPRSVGKGWQTSETVALPPAALLDITTNFNVLTADADALKYEGAMEVGMRRPEDVPSDIARVNLRNGGGASTGTFDTRMKLTRHHKTSLSLEMEWVMGDVKIEQSQSSFVVARLLNE